MSEKYAILTPTYVKHFVFIKSYLSSFRKYVVDKENIKLYFVVSRSEREDFEQEIASYKTLNITVLIFEDILTRFGVYAPPEELLNKYGRFTFQTLKKYYGLLFIPEERSLVLDSESMWINKTKMSKLFEDFFSRPRVLGSSLDNRPHSSPFFWQFIENTDFLLEEKCPYWFIENYMWFYEKRILQDLIDRYGTPIQLAEKLLLLHNKFTEHIDAYRGIFEITLYQNFLYFNREKYHYEFVDMETVARKYLSQGLLDQYVKEFLREKKGCCGVFEHVCLFLTKSNIDGLARMFNELKISIMRCDSSNEKNLKLQEKFFNVVQPSILASSQNHVFGTNRMIIIREEKKKVKKHLRRFVEPLTRVAKWISEPFAIIFHLIRVSVIFFEIFLRK